MAFLNLTSLLKDKVDIKAIANEAKEYTLEMKDSQHSNNYDVIFSREAPYTREVITHRISQISVSGDSVELEEIKVGSAYFNVIRNVSSPEISITFIESHELIVDNILTKDDDGKRILPTDGTFLLPDDYYFSIEIRALPKYGDESVLVLRGEIVLEGQVQKEFETETEQFQKVSATFKPKRNNSIVYSE